MSYTCKYLQFGTENPVPGFEELSLDNSETPAPAYKIIADPVTKELWDLTFACQLDKRGTFFYTSNQKVPGGMEAKVKAWYNKEGGKGGGHYLTILPFLITHDDAGFPKDPFVVKFDAPEATDNSINTDNIPGSSVTAVVPTQLKLAKMKMHSENNGFFITTIVDLFDHFEPVLMDKRIVIEDNKVTVPKGHSCILLAVYKEKESTIFKPVRTTPNRDIIPEIGIDIMKDLMAKETVSIMPDLSINVKGLTDMKKTEQMIDAVIEAHAHALN